MPAIAADYILPKNGTVRGWKTEEPWSGLFPELTIMKKKTVETLTPENLYCFQ